MKKTTKAPCPRCRRTVTHRTAKQRATCALNETAIIGREGFAIDGPQDRLAVTFAPAF